MRKLLLLFILCLFTLDSRAQWTSQATSFAAASRGVTQIFIVDPNTVWITAYDGTGASTKCRDFSVTSDAGATWISGTVPAATTWSWSCISAIDANTAWAMLFRYTAQYTGGIYKTTDGGANWTQQGAGIIFSTNNVSFPDVVYFWDANTGVALGDPLNGEYEIYTTSDGGSNWNAVSGAGIVDPTANETGLTASFCVRNGIIWCGTTDGRILKSTDQGQTWEAFSTGYSGYFVPKPVFANENLGWSQVYHVNSSNVVDDRQFVRTTDGGNTWTTLSPSGPYHYGSISYIPYTITTLISTGIDYVNGDLGSSYSLDGGDSWIEIDTGVQHGEVEFYDNATGWCGGFNTDQYTDGIFKYD
ncbi:MAG TPA: hypothetical protein VE978_23415, partial [Chitinophagales bacterium]|nr:hypothetical protein [Chitinophagales bacterium]